MAGEVAIKLRYGVTWETITRQQRLGASDRRSRDVLAAGAAALMRKAWTRRPIRLIGLRAGRSAPALRPTRSCAGAVERLESARALEMYSPPVKRSVT